MKVYEIRREIKGQTMMNVYKNKFNVLLKNCFFTLQNVLFRNLF